MRFIVKLFALLVAAITISSLIRGFSRSVMANAVDSDASYLVVGLDNAAENADVVLIVTVRESEGIFSFIQIPRDTYCEFESAGNKINQIHSSLKYSGASSDTALQVMKEYLEDSLGIHLDGYIALTMSALSDTIDAIGGVRVTLPEDFDFYASDGALLYTLHKGENILDGRQSVNFIRYRQSYALGDLGRIDAQKIFLSGLYKTVTESLNYRDIIQVAKSLKGRLYTDFSIADTISLLIGRVADKSELSLYFLTMPGKAVKAGSGAWYYALSRASAEDAVSKYALYIGEGFDPNRNFDSKAIAEINNIYNEKNVSYRVYKDNDVLEINIIRTK